MKKILNNWRNYCLIVENEDKQVQEVVGSAIAKANQNNSKIKIKLETVGDLRRIIQLSREDAASREAVINGLKTLAGFTPGIGNVLSVLVGSGDFVSSLRKIYGFSDDKSMPPTLKKLNVDDKTSYVVDDKLEAKFLNFLLNKFKEVPPETPLENFDSTKLLNQFLDKRFEREVKKG